MRHRFLFGLLASLLFASCDYFGDFAFEIVNNTGSNVVVGYHEQYFSTEDILPTYRHGDDYQPGYLSPIITDTTLGAGDALRLRYDVGLVGRDFPTEQDTPERYGIIPLWDRIEYITVDGDTLAPEAYQKDKWGSRTSGIVFTLVLIKK